MVFEPMTIQPEMYLGISVMAIGKHRVTRGLFHLENLQSKFCILIIYRIVEICFRHEYISGYYMVISYFLAKLVADLIPMRTISPIIFGSVTYWMVGKYNFSG